MEKKMEATIVYRGCIAIVEQKMAMATTIIVYWRFNGIMENKIGTYYGILGLFSENGKELENYCVRIEGLGFHSTCGTCSYVQLKP